ncbi:MAG: hypothetical protein QW272_09720 [Candidatus Methanomethylicaceae archaeon]
MATLVDIASIYGGNWVGKGISRLVAEADARLGLGPEVYKTASFWTTVAATIGVPLYEWFFRKGRLDALDLILLSIGGQISTNLLDYIEHYLLKKSYPEFAPKIVEVLPSETEEEKKKKREELIY